MMYQNIEAIGDNIPLKYFEITHLFLSNNNITSWKGIEKFKTLTHLSVPYNLIYNINEFDYIYDKDILLSLSVKGNFFCKNPESNISLILTFPKIQTLDGFKITDATFKVIKEKQRTTEDLMTFFCVIKSKIATVQRLTKWIKINREYLSKYSSDNSSSDFDERIVKIIRLLKYNNITNIDEKNMNKYLKKNINPSVHVVKKMINKFIEYNQDINAKTWNKDKQNDKYFTDKDWRSIYESIFKEIIFNYEYQKNESELPSYINYLILQSNPILLKFIKDNNITKEEKQRISVRNNYSNIVENINISRNWTTILWEDTNWNIDMIRKIQWMYFYNMGNTEFLSGKDFVATNNDVYVYYDEWKQKEVINVKGLIVNTCKFWSGFNSWAFPLFALNFDYMRAITNIIQNKIRNYYDSWYEIKGIVNMWIEGKKEFELVNINMNKTKRRNDISKEINKGKSKSKSKSKSRSHSRSRSKSTDNNNRNICDDGLFKYNFSDESEQVNNRRNIKTIKNNNFINDTDKQSTKRNKENNINNSNFMESNKNQSSNRSKDISNNPDSDYQFPNNAFPLNMQKQNMIQNNHPTMTPLYEIKIKAPIRNDLITLGDAEEPTVSPDKNRSTSKSNNIASSNKKQSSPFHKEKPSNMRKLAKITKYTKIGEGIIRLKFALSHIIWNRLYPKWYSISKQNKSIQFFNTLNKYSYMYKLRKFLNTLHRYRNIILTLKSNRLASYKQILLRAWHDNYYISKYEKNFYFVNWKSKSIISLLKNKVNSRNKKHKENKAMRFYYYTWSRKWFLVLKFNRHQSSRYQAKLFSTRLNVNTNNNPTSKQSNCDFETANTEDYSDKIFNFFHSSERGIKESDTVEMNFDYNKYTQMFSGRNWNNRDNYKDNLEMISESEEKAQRCKEENMNPVDKWLSQLESKYIDLKGRTKTSQVNLELEEEKVNKPWGIKKKSWNEKEKYKKNSNFKYTITCPYCVSGMNHSKCVGVSNGEGSLLVGAPNYVKTTTSTVSKNY